VFATVQLAKLILARIKYIVDPVLKRRLEQSNLIVQQMPEQLVQYTVATFENNDPQYALWVYVSMRNNLSFICV
jgi:hypothetical protein